MVCVLFCFLTVYSLFFLKFPFKVGTPLVELQVNKEWCKVSDAAVRFTVASTYQRSSWDWIAIYKVILELVLAQRL